MPLSRRQSASPQQPVVHPGTPDTLRDVLRHGGSETERRIAALDLAAVPGSEPVLIAALGKESATGVREAIVTALVGMATTEAASGLVPYLGSEDVDLRNGAVEGLQQIGLAAADPVRVCLTSADPDVRIFAATILGGLRHPDVRSWLTGMLADEGDVPVGLAIVEALAHVGTSSDVAALRAFARRFPDETLLAYAVDMVCSRIASCRAA
jgi:HEAT repeat protein